MDEKIKELIRQSKQAVKMLCDWRPDFLEQNEAKEYDDQVSEFETSIKAVENE